MSTVEFHGNRYLSNRTIFILITRADFRRVFSCSGWESYRPHRNRDELSVFPVLVVNKQQHTSSSIDSHLSFFW